MENRNYYVTRDKKKKETVYFEYDKIDGYSVHPKVSNKGAISVNKIVFVNNDLSEKIIRKKIDKKIEYLLDQLKLIAEDDSGDDGIIKKSLMDAERLRMQIINNYVKYLGNTYQKLTLKKLQVIIDQLRYNLYMFDIKKKDEIYEEEKTSRHSR